MQHLEFRFKLDGYPTLEPATNVTLMDQDGVDQMPAEQVQQMLKDVSWASRYAIQAQFQDAGVFITPEWAVLVKAQSLLHCVSVLCDLLNLIEEALETHVTITLVTVLDKEAVPLYGYLARQAKLLTARKIAGIAALLLLGGIVGALADNWAWPLLFVGQSP